MPVRVGDVEEGADIIMVKPAATYLDVIAAADWVLDLGPEGGAGGGMVVAQGTPEALTSEPQTHTGEALHRRHSASAIPSLWWAK